MNSSQETNVDDMINAAGDWRGANPFEDNFRDNPYPSLHALRQSDPVNLTPVNTWRISRYADVAEVFRTAKSRMTLADGSAPNFDPLDKRGSFLEFMLNLDGDEHQRLRRLALQSFNIKTVKMMEDDVRQAVAQVMDTALKNGGMDVVEDMASYIPSRMMSQIMGIPFEDRPLFNEWTAARTNAFFGRFLPPEVQQRTRDAGNAMADYFEALTRERRKNLGDDLISSLIRAESDGDRLRDGELVVQAIGIIVAGYETTIGLISNGMRALLEHPDQLELLRDNPELTKNAVEECLRYDTPILFNWRVLAEPYEVSGRTLPENSVLWMMLGSANRDPERFDAPDVFDIRRKDVAHMAFGGGAHFCLGNQLARMEARYAFDEFAKRTRGLEVRKGDIQWSHSFFRVMAHMPISFH